jgi:hypothetical protein
LQRNTASSESVRLPTVTSFGICCQSAKEHRPLLAERTAVPAV